MIHSLDFSDVVRNVRMGVKLTGLRADPLEARWVKDEFDFADAVSTIKYFMKHTSRMVGKTKHPNQPFDHIDDVRRDVEEHLIVGKSPEATALLKRHNLTTFHLIVDPVLQVLAQIPSHQECIAHVDAVVDHAIELIMNSGVETTHDDALVAKRQVSALVVAREGQRKAMLAKKKQGRRKKVIEVLESVPDADLELDAFAA